MVELTSGWPRLNGRVFQVSDVDTGTFTLVGARTGNVSAYPPGTGDGSFRKVLTWETVSQITEFAPSGGEQQYLDVDFLENEDTIQYPTSKSPMTVAVTCADDPSLPFFDIVEDADDDKATLAHRLNLKNGSRVYYNGIPSITVTPSTTRDAVATRVISIAVQARPSRVASVVASGS